MRRSPRLLLCNLRLGPLAYSPAVQPPADGGRVIVAPIPGARSFETCPLCRLLEHGDLVANALPNLREFGLEVEVSAQHVVGNRRDVNPLDLSDHGLGKGVV